MKWAKRSPPKRGDLEIKMISRTNQEVIQEILKKSNTHKNSIKKNNLLILKPKHTPTDETKAELGWR